MKSPRSVALSLGLVLAVFTGLLVLLYLRQRAAASLDRYCLTRVPAFAAAVGGKNELVEIRVTYHTAYLTANLKHPVTGLGSIRDRRVLRGVTNCGGHITRFKQGWRRDGARMLSPDAPDDAFFPVDLLPGVLCYRLDFCLADGREVRAWSVLDDPEARPDPGTPNGEEARAFWLATRDWDVMFVNPELLDVLSGPVIAMRRASADRIATREAGQSSAGRGPQSSAVGNSAAPNQEPN